MKSHSIDEDRLQRLVDGEMDAQKRREFMIEAEEHPQWWRDIALGFVEDQIFSETIRSVADESEASLPHPHRSSVWRQLTTFAACLAVAGATGYFIGKAPQVEESVVSQNNNVVDREVPPYRVQLVSDSGSPENTLELPAYDASQMTAFLDELKPQESLRQANEDLEPHGYRMDWETRFISGELDDGGRVVLPVSTLEIRYQGQ